jgi:hypothetical protein
MVAPPSSRQPVSSTISQDDSVGVSWINGDDIILAGEACRFHPSAACGPLADAGRYTICDDPKGSSSIADHALDVSRHPSGVEEGVRSTRSSRAVIDSGSVEE